MGFIRCCFRLKCQTVCKPGSVPPRVCGGDGHSSGTFVAERLARPTRAAARQARPAAPQIVTRGRRLPLLLGLAPGGVCPAAAVAGGAVRSYRTISPLPPMPSHEASHGRRGLAVCFCGTFPGVAPAGRYPAPCLRGARTFLPPADRKAGRRAAIRPSGMGRYGMRSDLCKPTRRIASAPARTLTPREQENCRIHPVRCDGTGESNPAPDSNPTPDRDSNAVCCRFAVDAAENRSRDRPPSSARHPVCAWLGPDPCGDSAHRTLLSMLNSAAAPGWPGPRRKADGV